jgi:hypothetical protein
MRNFILPIFILSSFSVFSQVNIINRTGGGFEILPDGIRGNLPIKPVDSTNIAIGTDALKSNLSSHRNIAIGNEALRLFNLSNNDLNTSQIAIGHGALKKYNPIGGQALGIAIGKNALGNVTNDARDNIVIGHFASENNRGDGKIVIGHRAMSSGIGGTDTDGGIYLGNYVAFSAPSSGAGNVVVGTRAMFNGGQYYNTILGEEAGYGVSTASNIGIGNVMLGYKAGKNSTGGNKLYIENSDSTNTLIGGDFVLNRVGINRTIAQLTSTNRTFQVEGSALISDVLQLPLGAGLGKVLTSDGVGNASWQTVTSGNWQVIGTNSARGGFNNNITDGTSNTILIGESNNQSAGRYLYGTGWGLELSGFANTVVGAFNTIPTGSNSAWVASDPLFIVGNGQSNLERSNAMIIQKNGVVNIGTSPNSLITYKLRVGGSISATSTMQAATLRSTNLVGAGERDVCTDDNGNLIECSSSHNVSAMGFHPQTTSTSAAASFERDIINGFVSFANNTKSTEAKMFAPVELLNGFPVKKILFHHLSTTAGDMSVKFMAVAKLNSGPAIELISVLSTTGSGVLESSKEPGSPIIIDNSNFYYFLKLEAGSTWKGTTLALRGVVFLSTSDK